MSPPSIACIGIIGKQDNPLHIKTFPPHDDQEKATLDFTFLLHASLDLFDARCRDRSRFDQDLGLLQVIDERLSLWGWQTGTSARFVIIIDNWGRDGRPALERRTTGDAKSGKSGGNRPVQDADVRSAFKALQTAYIRLLQNPFYVPDDHTPDAATQRTGKSGAIESKKFIQEVARIGESWKPGLSVI